MKRLENLTNKSFRFLFYQRRPVSAMKPTYIACVREIGFNHMDTRCSECIPSPTCIHKFCIKSRILAVSIRKYHNGATAMARTLQDATLSLETNLVTTPPKQLSQVAASPVRTTLDSGNG